MRSLPVNVEMTRCILGGVVVGEIEVLHLLLDGVEVLAVGLGQSQTLRDQVHVVLLEGEADEQSQTQRTAE